MARGGDRFGLETWAAAAPILFASNSSGIVGTTSVGGGGVGGGGGGAPASGARLPRAFIDGIDWQAVSRLVTVWEQLTARSETPICDGAHETGGCWLDAATCLSLAKMNFCEGSFLKRLN